jgi:hypothetical protein
MTRGYGPIDPRLFTLAQRPLRGTTDPAIAPSFIGQTYINTASGKVFQAIGTALDSWKLVSTSTLGLGLWIVVGALGTLSTSPDRVTWTARTPSPLNTSTSRIYDITYANNLLVAVGQTDSNGEPKIITSTDGITWTNRTPGSLTGIDRSLNYVTYTDKWVVVGESGSYLTSIDGITWTVNTDVPTNGGTGVAFFDFGGALCYFSTAFENPQLQRSTNGGASWASISLANSFQLSSAASSGSRLVAIGESTINYSDNGVSWITANDGTANTYNEVAYGNGLFVVVGNGGVLLTSPDGATWTIRTSGTTESLFGVGFHSGRWVAVGNNSTLISSLDGTTWSAEPSPVSGALRTLYDIIYA